VESIVKSLVKSLVKRVCMCMYVYMYACMYACMYVCVYACMYVCKHVGMYACLYVCVCVSVYVCECVSMYVCMYDGCDAHPRPQTWVRHQGQSWHSARVCFEGVRRVPLWFPRRARFWGPKRTPKTGSTVGAPTVGTPPVGLVFGYRNRPPELGLPPRSKPVSCVEFCLARPQTIFEFVNHSRTGLLVRPLCETPTINQLRPDVD
jgi:hypothetical protein